MARRNAPGAGALPVLAVAGVILAVLAMPMAPLLWLLAEAWRASNPKPLDGFRLDEAGYQRAARAQEAIRKAETRVGRIEDEAIDAGLRVRADGLWDRRNPKATDLNMRKNIADAELVQAQRELGAAMAGPYTRWETWAAALRATWAMRALTLAWGATAVVAFLGLGLVGVGGDEAALVVLMGDMVVFAAGWVGGLVAAVVGFFIPSGQIRAAAPGTWHELLRRAEEEFGTLPDPAQPDLASAEDEPDDAELAGALALVVVLKHVAMADGSIDIDEAKAIAKLVTTILPDTWRSAAAAALAEVGTLDAGTDNLEVATTALKAYGKPDLCKQVFAAACAVASEGRGVRGPRVAHVGALLGVPDDFAHEMLEMGGLMGDFEVAAPSSGEETAAIALIAILKHVAEADDEVTSAERNMITDQVRAFVGERAIADAALERFDQVDGSFEAVTPVLLPMRELPEEVRLDIYKAACQVGSFGRGNRFGRLLAMGTVLGLPDGEVERLARASQDHEDIT